MAFCGTITVGATGFEVGFSTDPGFRAKSLYLYSLTAGNDVLLDISTTAGCSTGFTLPALTFMQFPALGGITGFSCVASSAGGSADISYAASR